VIAEPKSSVLGESTKSVPRNTTPSLDPELAARRDRFLVDPLALRAGQK
jgi:hypothetical protein